MQKEILMISMAFNFLLGNVKAQSIDKALSKKMALVEQEAAKEPDEGITGEVHKSNIGKILFSSSPIKKETMNSSASQYKTSFVLGDLIYARAFLSKGINQYVLVSKPNYVEANFNNFKKSCAKILIYSDGNVLLKGESIGSRLNEYSKNEKDQFVTSCEFSIVKSPNEGGMPEALMAALNSLLAGTHTIKIEFWGDNDRGYLTLSPIAVGEFTLQVKENSKIKIGVSFDDVKTGMVNKDLEEKIVIAANKTAEINKLKEVYLKAKIIYEQWSIIRNKVSGVITGRSVIAMIYGKWPDGHCGYRRFEVKETYDGTKYLGDYFAFLDSYEVKTCDCMENK